MAINVTWLQQGGYTAAQDRTEQTAMLTKSAVVSVRGGIIPSDGTDATVTAQGTPNLTVNVSPFQAIIPDANGRAYVYTSDSPVVSPAFANGSGANPRIDLLIARVYDNSAGDSAATTSLTLPGSAGSITVQSVTGTIEIVQGTPGASPAAPSLPNTRCIILAVVTVPTSASTIITGDIGSSGGGASRAPSTVAAGGAVPVTTFTALPAAAYNGMLAWTNDTSQLWSYITGTGWQQVTAGYLLGKYLASSPITLSTGSLFKAAAGVTITLPVARQIRVRVESTLLVASNTAGQYLTQGQYSTGGSIGASAGASPGCYLLVPGVTGNTGNYQGSNSEEVFDLAAGTYTFWASYQRTGGGSTSDLWQGSELWVYDAGRG